MDDNSIWESQKIICLQILEELEQLPIYQTFRAELKCHLPPKQNPNDYPPQILNLAIIRERIENNTYQSFKEWSLDTNLFFSTILRRCSVDDLFKVAAKYLNEKYHKKLKIFELQNQGKWTQKSFELKDKIDQLLANSPDPIKSNLPRSFIFNSGIAEFSNQEADYLTRCIQLVHDQSDLVIVSNILKKDSTPLLLDKADVTIDLRHLHKQTLCELMDFFTKRFPEEPIPQ